MAKKKKKKKKDKTRRINLSIPSDVVDELNALGPVNKSKLAAEAFKTEVERIRREGDKKVTLRVHNFCEVPVVLTFGDEGEAESLTLRPSKLPAAPKQEVGVVTVAPWPLAARMDVEGRTDVWAVPRS